jgi:hypothetical protein
VLRHWSSFFSSNHIWHQLPFDTSSSYHIIQAVKSKNEIEKSIKQFESENVFFVGKNIKCFFGDTCYLVSRPISDPLLDLGLNAIG